uniref:Uncharacterized protein n=1 Tax=Siphoviridae sp. ctr8v12 TaxID=2825685 RepID=A0A8S5QGX6_9CAUD|nr:MAG TPA: hypothetical protein [Siphoviridae sp. ctr8v12]
MGLRPTFLAMMPPPSNGRWGLDERPCKCRDFTTTQ